MMKLRKYILTISVVFCFSSFTLAQSLKSLEENHTTLNVKIQKETSRLDSLKHSLNLKLKNIDVEKDKQNKDKNKIKNLMASAIITSNKVNYEQNRLDSLQNLMNNIQEALSKKYSTIIDSLEKLSKSKNYEGNREKLKSKILNFTEKKLKLSPNAGLLSFNPKKILEIDLNKTNDLNEKNIYREYLQNALSEVNKKLKNVDDKSAEIKNIIKLKKKAKNFITEAELDNSMTPQRISEKYPTTTSEIGTGPGPGRVSDAKSIGNQIQYYNLLLNQLNYIQTPRENFNLPAALDSTKPNMSLETYQKLLTELNTKLKEYWLILLHKLGQSK